MGYGAEFIGALFYHEMDWEDKAFLEKEKLEVKEDDIHLYHQVFGDTIINELLFMRIVLDYSKKVLETYEGDESLGNAWVEAMKEGIEKLSDKLRLQS